MNHTEVQMLPSPSVSVTSTTIDAIDQLSTPDFRYPWTGACHPNAPTIERKMLEWLENYGLVINERYRSRIVRSKFGWLAARCHPYASVEHLQVIANFYAWYFLVDDLYVDRVETVSSRTIPNLTAIIDVLDLDCLGNDPVYGEAAWVDLCQRLKLHMSDEHFQRFAHGMRMWAGAAGLQILEHTQSQTINLRQYETIRRHVGGMYPSLDLIDFGNDLPLAPDEYYRADVQRLRRHTNNIVCWSNDLQSLAMELKQPGQYKNMVAIYLGQGHSLQASVDYTANKIRAEIHAFTQTAASSRPHATRSLLRYIEGMELWMGGYQDWVTHDTQRYASAFIKQDADDRDLAG